MTFRQFINRPLGGIELEIFLGSAALLWAVPLLLWSDSVWNSLPLQSYYDYYPHWMFAIPWMIAGLSTLVGLEAYRRAMPWSRYLRRTGSFIGMIIWGWYLAKSFISVGADTPFFGIYFLAMVGCVRVFISASRAWRAPPWVTG